MVFYSVKICWLTETKRILLFGRTTVFSCHTNWRLSYVSYAFFIIRRYFHAACVCAVEWLSGWLAPVAKAKMNVSHEANREDGKIKQCFERILSCCRHNPKGERERKKCRTKKGGVCHNVSRYNL